MGKGVKSAGVPRSGGGNSAEAAIGNRFRRDTVQWATGGVDGQRRRIIG